MTGAGRGIGAAAAAALATAGASVAVLARSTDEIAQVAARLRDVGHASSGVTCDVGDPAAVRVAVAQVERGRGPVDGLINNAGVVAPLGPTAEIDVQAWAAALAINLTGAFACIQAVLPRMRARRWGRSVNVSTEAATGTGLGHANAYSVSKAGLEMLTANLAAELAGTGVTVNATAVRPGSSRVRCRPPCAPNRPPASVTPSWPSSVDSKTRASCLMRAFQPTSAVRSKGRTQPPLDLPLRWKVYTYRHRHVAKIYMPTR